MSLRIPTPEQRMIAERRTPVSHSFGLFRRGVTALGRAATARATACSVSRPRTGRIPAGPARDQAGGQEALARLQRPRVSRDARLTETPDATERRVEPLAGSVEASRDELAGASSLAEAVTSWDEWAAKLAGADRTPDWPGRERGAGSPGSWWPNPAERDRVPPGRRERGAHLDHDGGLAATLILCAHGLGASCGRRN